MGTSLTGFKGYCFWARDPCLAAWMANLVDKIDASGSDLTSAQKEFRADLIFQASLCSNGAVDDCLSHLERSEDIRNWASNVGREALAALIEAGETIDGAWLNSLLRAPGSIQENNLFSNEPMPAAGHIEYGRKWLALITGDFEKPNPHPSGSYQSVYRSGYIAEIEVDYVYLSKR